MPTGQTLDARGALLDGRTTHRQRALSPADAQPLALK